MLRRGLGATRELPVELEVRQLEGTSEDDMWLLGEQSGGRNQVLHWNGSVWSKVGFQAEPTRLDVAGRVLAVVFDEISGLAVQLFHRVSEPAGQLGLVKQKNPVFSSIHPTVGSQRFDPVSPLYYVSLQWL